MHHNFNSSGNGERSSFCGDTTECQCCLVCVNNTMCNIVTFLTQVRSVRGPVVMHRSEAKEDYLEAQLNNAFNNVK